MDGGNTVSRENRFLAFLERCKPQHDELKQKGVTRLRKEYDRLGLAAFDGITATITDRAIERIFGKFFLDGQPESPDEQKARELFVADLCRKLGQVTASFATYESEPRTAKPHFGEDVLGRLASVLFWVKEALDFKTVPQTALASAA